MLTRLMHWIQFISIHPNIANGFCTANGAATKVPGLRYEHQEAPWVSWNWKHKQQNLASGCYWVCEKLHWVLCRYDNKRLEYERF